VLECIPAKWLDRLLLLQNELLPADWQKHELNNPTVISVWFEKKKGQDAKVIIPSPVFGPKSQLVHDALASIDITCKVLSTAEELLFELVVKNVYIVTTNVAGLKTGGTVGELWDEHKDIATKVSQEIISIQQALTAQEFDADKLIDSMVDAFNGDLEHKCMGRSALGRLERALDQAKKYNLNVPVIQEIASQV